MPDKAGVSAGGLPRRWQTGPVRRVIAAAASLVLVTTGCSGSGAEPDPVRDTSDEVAFTPCGDQCSGTLNGAEYQILLPQKWNGTLLLYSHGYRSAVPQPPDNRPVTTAAEPAPGYASGQTGIADNLLEQGFALAGSSWASNGWAVEDGVRAGNELYEHFAREVATPNRVYVWGDSLGGLVTEELAEGSPQWVDGAAPLCGAHAGVVPNLNLALDLAEGVRVLLEPDFKTHDYDSAAQATRQWDRAAAAVVKAAGDVDGGGTAEVLALGALVDAAPQTKTYDAADVTSRVKGTTEAIVTGLGFGTIGRFDVEQRYGQVSGTMSTDYAARFSDADRQLIDSAGGAGTTDEIVAKLQASERVMEDSAAVRRAEKLGGSPSGALNVPTITLHTAADPLVLVQNQSYLNGAYQDARRASGELVQLFTVPPPSYKESTGAPYGAGHCNFTPRSRIGVISLLDDWVRNGVYPAPARVRSELGPNSGYDPMFQPGRWPASTDQSF